MAEHSKTSSISKEELDVSQPSLRELLTSCGVAPQLVDTTAKILEGDAGVTVEQLQKGALSEQELLDLYIKIGPAKAIRSLVPQQSVAPPGRLEDTLFVEKIVSKFFQKPPDPTSVSFSELFETQKSGAGIVTVKQPDQASLKSKVAGWKKMAELLKSKESKNPKNSKEPFEESDIQTEFPKLMTSLYVGVLKFVDTHTNHYLVSGAVPDVVMLSARMLLLTQSILAVVELKSYGKHITGTVMGQVMNSTNRLHRDLVVKRDVWGFGINGCENDSFVYHKLANGNYEMGYGLTLEQLFGLFDHIAGTAEGSANDLPTAKGFQLRGFLGCGKTSNVYCVEEEVTEEVTEERFMVLKVPKDKVGERVVCGEIDLMKRMEKMPDLRQHKHLAKFYGSCDVKVGDMRTIGLISYPCALDKSKEQLLMIDDVVDLALALSDLHKSEIFHRDISPSNIGFYSTSSGEVLPFLRDFGFSSQGGEERYAGGISTASTRVLNFLLQGNLEFTFERADDVESLLKTIYILATGARPAGICDSWSSKARCAKSFWQSKERLFSEAVKFILTTHGYYGIRASFLSLPSRSQEEIETKKEISPIDRTHFLDPKDAVNHSEVKRDGGAPGSFPSPQRRYTTRYGRESKKPQK